MSTIDPIKYLAAFTGLPVSDLVGPSARVRVRKVGNVYSIAKWDPTLPMPTPEQLEAGLAAPDPGPTVAELLGYASDKQNTLLAQIWSFNVGTQQAPLLVTTKLDAAGQAAMMKVGRWAERNASVTGATLAYTNVDLTGVSLTATQAESLDTQAAAIDTSTYTALNAIVAAAQAIPPTITTFAQIDAFAWPIAS